MYILNFYENYNQLKTSVASSNLDDALSSIKNIASLYVNGWHKEHELVTFRIEVINQEAEDIKTQILLLISITLKALTFFFLLVNIVILYTKL